MASGAFLTLFFQFSHEEKLMIFYFVGTCLVAFALFKLGQYAAILAVISNAGKVAVLLLAVAAAVLLYRKFRGHIQVPRLPWLSDR